MAPEVWFPNLGIEIQKLDNVAFNEIFGIHIIDIYWYGIIICAGIVSGILLLLREVRRTGQDADKYTDMVLVGIVASIVGARIYYVVFSWDQYKNDLWSIFNVRKGGLAIYGAIIAAVIVGIYFAKRKNIAERSFFKIADTVAPSLALGQAIGRWGNFFNREAYGGFTDGLFAMRYKVSQIKEVSQALIDNVVTARGTEYIQVHPTFLYESLWNLGVFIFLMVLRKRKKFTGEVVAVYFLGYASGRIWIEGLRTDQLIIGSTGIAVSQLLSGIIIVAAVVFIIWRRKKEAPGNGRG